MSKRAAVGKRVEQRDGINPKQPCPCGSGKRYKVCHGAPGGVGDVIVTRPFAGLAAECELVALREFVPSATVELPLGTDRKITLCTVLPMAAAGIVRGEHEALVGMQVQTRSGDISRDLGRAVDWAGTAASGAALPVADTGGEGKRLQDLLAADAELVPQMHDDFAWWIPDGEESTPEVALSLERANAAIMPTARVEAPGVRAAYWVDAGDKAHLRWVRQEPEEQLLPAMAKLAARGQLTLGEGSRYAGSFRAHGLLVPVWDLDPESHAREWAEPAEALGARLADVLSALDAEPLTESERRSLYGLRGRQVTLR
ncbi:MAG: DUF5926 family protein [Sciscionella sp.]